MANFCLLPEQIDAFKNALKTREIDIAKLLDMTTEERTKVFEQYAGADAKEINTQFEQKLILKNRMIGIQNLLSKLGEFGKNSPEAKVETARAIEDYKKAQTERIFSPAEHQSFLNDLADKRVGAHIDVETAQKVMDLTKVMNEAKEAETNSFSGVSDDYLKARKNLNDFIDAQKPITPAASIIRNLMTIGRNNLITNPSTPIKATSGQIINSTIDSITRRIGNLSLNGANHAIAVAARKQAWQTFLKTGQNTAIMESLDDNHALGKGENFKVSNTGKTANPIVSAIERGVQKATAISNKIAIDLEHNYSFTRMYQGTFFDAANMFASNIARSEGLAGTETKVRAADILKDASRIEPETQEGAMVRLEAQKAAARITSTNNTLVSNFSMGAKNVLNKIVPGVPLGDLVMPIAKIPASIVANGIDNAGAGIPVAIRDIMQGRVKIQSNDLQTKYEGMAQLARGIQRTARIAGVMGTAFLIASQFKKSDFRSDNYGNHFFKVGNTWINTEYLSAISPALAGAMAARENKTNGIDQAAGYVAGVAAPLKGVPGVDEANDLITSITNTSYTKGIKKYASDFFTSRGVPAFVPNMLKDRPIDRLLFGAHGVESVESTNKDAADSKKKSAATRNDI